jgi:hypothetical protein
MVTLLPSIGQNIQQIMDICRRPFTDIMRRQQHYLTKIHVYLWGQLTLYI